MKIRRPRLFDVLRSPAAAELSVLDRLVAVYLAYRQGRNSTTWPSLRRTAADLGVDRRVVIRSITRLVAVGLVVKQPGGRGRGHVNRYQIILPEKVTESHLLDEIKGDWESPEKVTTVHVKGDWESPEVQGSIQEKVQARSARTATPRRNPFVPPTVREVREYAASQGQPGFDAERFVGYYEAADWHDVGGTPVTDWKARVRTWIRRDAERAAKSREDSDREDAEIDAMIAYGAARLEGGQR